MGGCRLDYLRYKRDPGSWTSSRVPILQPPHLLCCHPRQIYSPPAAILRMEGLPMPGTGEPICLLPLLRNSPRQAGAWSGAASAIPQAACSAVWGGGVRPWQGLVSLLQPKDPPMSSALSQSHRRSGRVEGRVPHWPTLCQAIWTPALPPFIHVKASKITSQTGLG